MTNGSTVTANPETVEGMLESLGKISEWLNMFFGKRKVLGTNSCGFEFIGHH